MLVNFRIGPVFCPGKVNICPLFVKFSGYHAFAGSNEASHRASILSEIAGGMCFFACTTTGMSLLFPDDLRNRLWDIVDLDRMSLFTFDIFTSNGDQLQFHSDDEVQITRILHQLNTPRIFSTKMVIFATEFSVVNIPGEAIEAIRLSTQSPEVFGLHDLDGLLTEISQDQFEQEYTGMAPEERVAARHADPGEIIQVYLKLNLESGRSIFLKLQVPKKSGPEGRLFFTHLFDNPATMFSLPEGGKGLVNPKRLSSIVNFPGPGADVLPGTTLYATPQNLFVNSID